MNEDNKPRASIHVGSDKKTFSAQISNEAERRGWNEKRYQLKNAEAEKNNHYNFSRKHLNFEITKGGKIIPLGSNPIPLHVRLQQRHDELGFKPYMDADHPGQIAKNSPNCLVNIIFGGDHEIMKRLAFGEQELDTSDPHADHRHIVLKQSIYDWALDTYKFACRKWGEENIIGFCVHCDETGIHAHVLTVPVEQVKKRGRIGSVYISKDNPDVQLSTKEWKALPKGERANYIKETATKEQVERISYAKVWGETRQEKSKYLEDLHTDYHKQVGYKYGLERGIPYEELSEEEKRGRVHKDKKTLEAERLAKLAIAEAKKQKAEIEAETAIVQQQKDEAKKELKSAQSGFLAKIFQPDKYKKEETEKLKESYDAGVKETIDTFIAASNLNWKTTPTAEHLGKRFRVIWDSEKNLKKDMKGKVELITQKDKEIARLNVKVTTLTEEVNGLKYRLTLIDEDAVVRLREEKRTETVRAEKAERELDKLRSDHMNLSAQWNALWLEPEFVDAAKKFKARKQREELEARQIAERKESILNLFIKQGHDAQRGFATQRGRYKMTDSESFRIYYGILAIAVRDKLTITGSASAKSAAQRFLACCSWSGVTEYQHDLHCHWTEQFAEKAGFPDDAVQNFIDFVDEMSCSAENYVSLSGSNGCADQLTNWDGSKKPGLAAPEKKKGGGMSR